MDQDRKKFVNKIRVELDKRAEEDANFEEINTKESLTQKDIDERVEFFSELIDSRFVKRVFSEREER